MVSVSFKRQNEADSIYTGQTLEVAVELNSSQNKNKNIYDSKLNLEIWNGLFFKVDFRSGQI